MSMRKQFVKTVESVLQEDDKLVLLLGDIGVFGFKNAFEKHPGRVYNVGILEQATISLAAGLAMEGLIPIVHTIAPFMVERALEQLKVDFGYQHIGGNFVSVGASYDYAALGCTHHCPGDIGVLKSIPNVEIVLPGTAREFDVLFRQAYSNNNPTYYRLSERENPESYNVKFGKAEIIKKGKRATIIAVGPALKPALEASRDMDVTVLYYTTIAPFDAVTLEKNCPSNKIIVCEPYYYGALDADILEAMKNRPVTIEHVGVPHRFLVEYGKAEEHDNEVGFTAHNIKEKINSLNKSGVGKR